MRCQICDHCDELPSIYKSGLTQQENPGRVRYYPETNTELCWRCARESKDDILQEDDEFNHLVYSADRWSEIEEGELPEPHLDEDYS